jgi:Zn-dependent metalloprotease
MYQNIEKNGTPEQQKRARTAYETSAALRAHRVARTEMRTLVHTVETTEKQRYVYDLRQGDSLPGVLARQEGSPPVDDPAVNEAYDGAGATYDLYKEIYERNSLDNRGMQLVSTVHYQTGYDNAFWNGQQMVYGDGDEDMPENQRLFNRFTSALDIIGHELTHGVVQFEAALVYQDQPGALNESFADVFGSLVKQWLHRQTVNEANWIIGEGLLTPNVNGAGIRSLKAPGTAYDDPVLGKDPQPAHMRDYWTGTYDSGGVHINSGIPNHAFYVTAMEIGGFAWEKAGLIWYTALRDRLSPQSDFGDAAIQTYLAAGMLFGNGSLEQQAVRTGWRVVGIPLGSDNGDTGDGGDGNGAADNGNSSGDTSGDGCALAITQFAAALQSLLQSNKK